MCGSVPLTGWVQSPGHPRGYDPNSRLTWKECAPTGHRITLTLIHLDLEESFDCEDDSLKVCVFERVFFFFTYCICVHLEVQFYVKGSVCGKNKMYYSVYFA